MIGFVDPVAAFIQWSLPPSVASNETPIFLYNLFSIVASPKYLGVIAGSESL